MIPIGEVPYESGMSMKTKYLLILINVLGGTRSDKQLLSVIGTAMHSWNRCAAVITEPQM